MCQFPRTAGIEARPACCRYANGTAAAAVEAAALCGPPPAAVAAAATVAPPCPACPFCQNSHVHRGCSGRGRCARGACACGDGWTGSVCDVPAADCPSGVRAADGVCCGSGSVDSTGACCGAAGVVDAAGQCCEDGAGVDACGVCGGAGAAVARDGVCCEVCRSSPFVLSRSTRSRYACDTDAAAGATMHGRHACAWIRRRVDELCGDPAGLCDARRC